MTNTAQITIIYPDGEINYADIPEDGKDLMSALQETVGGYIEVIPFVSTGKYMVVNEMAKLSPHEINRVATAIARDSCSISKSDYIAGTVAIIERSLLL
ncbi:MAG TPA: DUF3846 domain-containing protein [Rhodocyclaceae bacterium]|nr:DUF3846 domain-containing protein [Rhodocyclaceae bacterium]